MKIYCPPTFPSYFELVVLERQEGPTYPRDMDSRLSSTHDTDPNNISWTVFRPVFRRKYSSDRLTMFCLQGERKILYVPGNRVSNLTLGSGA